MHFVNIFAPQFYKAFRKANWFLIKVHRYSFVYVLESLSLWLAYIYVQLLQIMSNTDDSFQGVVLLDGDIRCRTFM